jgi:hypothetical protein
MSIAKEGLALSRRNAFSDLMVQPCLGALEESPHRATLDLSKESGLLRLVRASGMN